MITETKGNLMDSQYKLFLNVNNPYGILGAGLARQFATHFPECEKQHIQYCKLFSENPNDLKGDVNFNITEDNSKMIVDLFAMDGISSKTKQFNKYLFVASLQNFIMRHNTWEKFYTMNDNKISIPFQIGCGLAGGNWKQTLNMLTQFSEYHEINIEIVTPNF